MPLIQITMLEGRTPERKEKLIEEITKTVSTVLGAPLESIRIGINEIPDTNWGIGGKSVHRRKQEQEVTK